MKKRIYDFRYLLAAVALVAIAFAASLLLWPEWLQGIRALDRCTHCL